MDTFAQRIELLQGRVLALQQHASNFSDKSYPGISEQAGQTGLSRSNLPSWLPAALEELQTALEGLQVAEEKLQVQNEELAAARETIEAEHQRYQDLFELAPDGYLVTDTVGVIREANQAAVRMLNLGQHFRTGNPLSNFVVEEEARRAFRTQLNHLLQAEVFTTAQEWHIRLQPRSLEGTAPQAFEAALTVAPIRGAGGEAIALRWLLRDITERKQAEVQIQTLVAQLSQANADLEQRVRDRTAELEAANQLQAELLTRAQVARAVSETAQRTAEAANRIKDEFLATLSHELRTPLNAVLGWAQLLRSRRLDEQMIAQALETVERNAKLQTRLVEDLLDVSRMIQGKFSLNILSLELAPVIEAALNTVRPAAEAKGIRLETEIDPGLGLVQIDPDRWQQVMWNLLTNAVRFTDQGGCVRVQVGRLIESAQSFAQIRVSDTGKGISAVFLPYVFQRFCQAESTSTRLYGGLGIGLAIVRHLVELHGGTVQAESPGEGQGAIFTVRLPLTG